MTKSKIKVLIFGSNGMAGHTVAQFLNEKGYDVYKTIRKSSNESKTYKVDVIDFDDVCSLIEKIKPDIIVNAVAILNSFAEENPKLAIQVNSIFPKMLEKKLIDTKIKIIHLSTDCVFSGKIGNRKENDLNDGESIYAMTKSLGEINNNKDLTFRTSLIGPDLNKNGIGLFNWFMSQTNEVIGFNKCYWSGITTLELAKAIDAAVEQNLSGLYNLTSNPKISKYELLKIINDVFDKNINISKDEEKVNDKSLISTRTDFEFEIIKYREMLIEQKKWIDDHPLLYNK